MQAKTSELITSLDAHFASINTENQQKQFEIAQKLSQTEDVNRQIMQQLSVKEAEVKALVEKLGQQETTGNSIVAELTRRQEEMGTVRKHLDEVIEETRKIAADTTGGWKMAVEGEIQGMKTSGNEMKGTVQHVGVQISGIIRRIDNPRG